MDKKTYVTVKIRSEVGSCAEEREATVEVQEGETQSDAIGRVLKALEMNI